MNANRLISMAINMILRRVMRHGVDAGINAIAKRKGRTEEPTAAQGGKSNAPDPAQVQQRMRKSIRMGRRLGRF